MKMHLTMERRGDHLTNRCVELVESPNEFALSGWRGDVELGIHYRGDHAMTTHQLKDGFEFDLILTSRPNHNEFAYEIGSKNLTFCKQPPLTPEEIADGHRRPDNVVGSYAVYHSHKRDNHRLSDGREENYGCGKFGHIYRPKAVDATGKWAWCKMNIADGHLVIIAPQEFLDRAKYPVTIDPIIGTDSAGASIWDFNRVKTANNMCDSIITAMSCNGTVTSGSAYACLDNSDAGNSWGRMCIWRDNPGPPENNKEDSPRDIYSSVVTLSSKTPQWVGFNLEGTVLKDHSYGVGVTFNYYFTSHIHFYYDVFYTDYARYGQMQSQSCNDGTTTCIPATLGVTGDSPNRYSIYATYEEDAPEDRMYVAAGWIIGNVEVRDKSFQAELRGRAQHLQQNMLEVYTPGCRARLGDVRCGIDLEDSAGTYRHSGTISSVSDDRLVFIDDSVPGAITEDVFRFGLLTWNAPESGDSWSGNNAGFQIEVKKFDPSTKEFTLFQPMPYAIGVGDEFEVTWGCDKNLATCRDRFDNLVNFRGEPHIPSKSEVITVRDRSVWPGVS